MSTHGHCSFKEALDMPLSFFTLYTNSKVFEYSKKVEKMESERLGIIVDSIGAVVKTIKNYGDAFLKSMAKRR